MAKVPSRLEDGSPVIAFVELPAKILPSGYVPPEGRPPAIEPVPVRLFVIAKGKGADESDVYWVRGLDGNARSVVGEMYCTEESAKQFLLQEYGVQGAVWQSTEFHNDQSA
jgi:hypothetical protein